MVGRLAAIFASLTVLAWAGTGAAAAEDRSLTVDQYMSHGMPAPDRPWSSVDYGTAAQILGALPPDQLPRRGSDSSAAYMARLVDSENIESCTSATLPPSSRIGLCVGYIREILNVAKVYLVAMQKDRDYDDDTLDLTDLVLQLVPASLETADVATATLDKNDPSYEQRMGGLKQMKDGFAEMLDGSILSLTTERALYSDAARARLARVVADVYLRSGRYLEPLTLTEITQKLSKLAHDDPSPEIRAALAPAVTGP